MTAQSCNITKTNKPSIITDDKNLKLNGTSEISDHYQSVMKLYSLAVKYFSDKGYNAIGYIVTIPPADIIEAHKKGKDGQPCTVDGQHMDSKTAAEYAKNIFLKAGL